MTVATQHRLDKVPVNMRPIVFHASEICGITVDEFFTLTRTRKFSQCRYLAIYRMLEIYENDLVHFHSNFKNWFGLDRTVLYHAKDIMESQISVYPEWRNKYERLKDCTGMITVNGPGSTLTEIVTHLTDEQKVKVYGFLRLMDYIR